MVVNCDPGNLQLLTNGAGGNQIFQCWRMGINYVIVASHMLRGSKRVNGPRPDFLVSREPFFWEGVEGEENLVTPIVGEGVYIAGRILKYIHRETVVTPAFTQ